MSLPHELPGLNRLMAVCQRLELRIKTSATAHDSPQAGILIAGLPFDPMLAALYARFSHAAFATDVAGIILRHCDAGGHTLETDNTWWSEGYRRQFALPTFIFAGEALSASHYTTVPALADAQGYQPVIKVDVHEQPYALPVASTVDRLFEAYSYYLEALLALPHARDEGEALLLFPRDVPHIIGRDTQLVAAIRDGRFDPLMPGVDEQTWARTVINGR